MEQLTFEDLVIRKNYLSKTTGRVFDKQLKRFDKNIKITSGMMYNKYRSSFSKCGLDPDDIYSLSRLYSIYYFDIYSESVDPDETKQRNALITFIRQRTEYLARKCEKKSENFLVSKNLSGYYAKTSKSQEAPDDVIIGNPRDWGYRKISPRELREIRSVSKGLLKDKYGFEVVNLEFYDNISEDEYENILYKGSCVLKSPEDLLEEKQERAEIESAMASFEAKSVVNKIEFLKNMLKFCKKPKKIKDIKELIKILELSVNE